jgi:hypothetical protein
MALFKRNDLAESSEEGYGLEKSCLPAADDDMMIIMVSVGHKYPDTFYDSFKLCDRYCIIAKGRENSKTSSHNS